MLTHDYFSLNIGKKPWKYWNSQLQEVLRLLHHLLAALSPITGKQRQGPHSKKQTCISKKNYLGEQWNLPSTFLRHQLLHGDIGLVEDQVEHSTGFTVYILRLVYMPAQGVLLVTWACHLEVSMGINTTLLFSPNLLSTPHLLMDLILWLPQQHSHPHKGCII